MKRLFHLALQGFVTIIFLSACSGPRGDVFQSKDTTDTLSGGSLSYGQSAHFHDWNSSQLVIETGLRGIIDRYVRPLHLPDIAMAGIRGVVTLAPESTLQERPLEIILSLSHQEIYLEKPKDDDDIGAWTEVVLGTFGFLIENSKTIRNKNIEDIHHGFFDSLLKTLDSHSHYANADEALSNQLKRRGAGTVGVTLKKQRDSFVISAILIEGPAYKAGLRLGDRIISINGISVTTMSPSKANAILRGSLDSMVDLIFYPKKSHTRSYLSIQRTYMIPKTVKTAIQDDIFYASISSFNTETPRSFVKAFNTAQKTHSLKGIILDMRGNSGGTLKQAIQLADLFISKGKIIRTQGRHIKSLRTYQADKQDISQGLPIVVLIDGKSASSAEVASIALQDRGRALVVGTNSFGKGSVQVIIVLPNGAEIALTWSYLISPSGLAYHGLGVLPDFCTSNTHTHATLDAAHIRTNISPAIWRTPSMDQTEERKKLRQICPAEKRGGETEKTVAIKLLNNPDLLADAFVQFPVSRPLLP